VFDAGVAVAIVKVASDGQREGATITGANPAHRTYAIGKGQIAYYKALEAAGELRIIRTAAVAPVGRGSLRLRSFAAQERKPAFAEVHKPGS
jgi:hypothetical protein